MTYRKNTRLGVTTWVRLNDDGSITILREELMIGETRYFRGKSTVARDWENIYNNYSHINEREFNDAYNLVKENI